MWTTDARLKGWRHCAKAAVLVALDYGIVIGLISTGIADAIIHLVVKGAIGADAANELHPSWAQVTKSLLAAHLNLAAPPLGAPRKSILVTAPSIRSPGT